VSGAARADTELARCANCGAQLPAVERFCPTCHLPLVPLGEVDTGHGDPRHEWARKIKPQLAEGKLIRVVGARNQAEAEFVQGLLLEEGVPSLLRRSAGFDVPDFLAAGPRDILVPASGVNAAREVLLQAEIIGAEPTDASPRPARLFLGLLAALVLGAALVWLVSLLLAR
jgi:hypothetical protein